MNSNSLFFILKTCIYIVETPSKHSSKNSLSSILKPSIKLPIIFLVYNYTVHTSMISGEENPVYHILQKSL